MDTFESIWRDRVKKALSSYGCGYLWDKIDGQESSQAFTDALMDSLKVDAKECAGGILADCACHASHDDLEPIHEFWAQTHDLELVHGKLQEHFIRFIREYKDLNDEQIGFLTAHGWGMAGILIDTRVLATKIPALFHEYFATDDPIEKRYCYCHCPRIKESIRKGVPVDPVYCHCGMGFYLDIWRYILDRPVKGEIRASILKGDDVCSFCIELA